MRQVIALPVICCLLVSGPAARAAQDRPSIVVFLVDDMGLMDTSVPFLTDADGKPKSHPLNEFYRTPNMERLAGQGIRFSNFYAMSVCSPTRVSIMTGQTSARHRTTNWIRPESNNAGPYGAQDWQWRGVTPGHLTLPELLQEVGYRTIHCGKGHFGPNETYGEDPANFGFDVNIAGCASGSPGSYYGTEDFGLKKKGRERRAVPGLEKYHGEEIYLTEALTREINRSIGEAVDADQPFFAYMAHYAVHAPFQPDPRFAGHYSGEPDRVAAFASMIEGMDKSLGDMLDHLDALGVAEETLVFFVGDNGTDAPLGPLHEIACAAPLRGKKGTHYEGGMRVPFIAAWAAPNGDHPLQKRTPISGGTIVSDVGIVYDLFPTILALTGTDVSPDHADVTIDGIDLTPILTGNANGPENREFLMHFPHAHRSSYFTVFRNGNWKLIYHYRPAKGAAWGRYELFDLSQDRDESHNLAEERPNKLREMMTLMTASLEEAGAQYPLADDKTSRLVPEMPAAN
ncbi:Arylsulfatase precursor [Maioricimonas rarisocia]|uniref:Arylsulfatase n=1 Tax=Maioricimonas rarisocia TaxID=2528026 RepID=A0A517Z4V3_9PLAN|nr:sulfatase [Maioricimonas rarisocia]QDU37485.1 Arylsulfatase precursor [Maioricimonas rarisocia]